MVTDKALTKVLAMHLYAEGLGEVRDITDTTFWIKGKKADSRVEVHNAMLGNKVNFSSCCLCADFVLLALLDKTGDNLILLRTTELLEILEDKDASLVDMAGIIIHRWAVEFLPEPKT
tara:strand:+ start:1827 stop:2180 length:354 start_codon:yes stop_codon:yes gene_type:complete